MWYSGLHPWKDEEQLRHVPEIWGIRASTVKNDLLAIFLVNPINAMCANHNYEQCHL